MQDFTLYLSQIDPRKFSRKDSRFDLDCYADEWKTAWQSYETHILNAVPWLASDVADYALAGWRQDLRDALCIRKKPVAVEFSVADRAAALNVSNQILGRALTFQYEQVREFAWQESPTLNFADLKQSGAVRVPVLYLEELRFPSEGTIEHEVRFLDGAHLLITSASLTLNLSEYLAACEQAEKE